MLPPVLVFAFLTASRLQQPQTNYQRVITTPNPFNGYEQYIRATDVAHGEKLSLMLYWTPRQYDEMLQSKKSALQQPAEQREIAWSDDDERRLGLAKQLHALDYLGVQQTITHDFGGAMDFVRAGNLKQVWDPREKLDAASIFPELADFKTLAKLARATAYAKFAAGDSTGGTNDLLDGLTFARKIGGGTLISELVSVACQAILMAAFEERLAQLTDKDALNIVRFTDAALNEPPSYLNALKRERDMAIGSLDILFDHPADLGADGEEAMTSYLKSMSASEKRDARERLTRGIDEYYTHLLKGFGPEESSWLDAKDDSGLPVQPKTVTTVDDLVDTMMNILTPVHSQATLAVLKCRAQLRLLGLHARIIDFRWKNNRLPKDLKEAAPAALIQDPFTKTEFVYELKGDGYKLYSRGRDTTGPIELKYRRPANLPKSNDEPIPPSAATSRPGSHGSL